MSNTNELPTYTNLASMVQVEYEHLILERKQIKGSLGNVPSILIRRKAIPQSHLVHLFITAGG